MSTLEHLYSIAGYGFRLWTRIPGQDIRLKDSFRSFRVDALDQVDGDFEIVPEEGFPWPGFDPARMFLESETWSFGHTLDGKLGMDCAYVPAKFRQNAALLEPDFSRGVLFPKRLAPERFSPYTLFFPIDEQVFLNRMALLGGALIHCCGVVHQGRAILFCGRSGAGKSTTARLWREAGATVLNDDRIVIRPHALGVQAGATPWHGTLKDIHPAVLPLAAVFHLHQARENRAEPISSRQGTLRLMANAIAPFYREEPTQSILDTLALAGEQARHFNLYFRPDADAVATVRSAVDA
jgi:hypothetical protein